MLVPACQLSLRRSAVERRRKSALTVKRTKGRGSELKRRIAPGLRKSSGGSRKQNNSEKRSGRLPKKRSEDGRRRNGNGN
jgi:hypothetical protein